MNMITVFSLFMCNLRKSSFMWFIFSIPIVQMIVAPTFLYFFYIYSECIEREFNGFPPGIDVILFFIQTIMGCVFGIFIGCVFFKSPRGKHIFFILEPIVTILLCFGTLIYFFFVNNGKMSPIFQLWNMIGQDVIRVLNLCTA